MSDKTKKYLLIFLYIFFFLSGMTGLIYEILWTRMLSLTFGHTVFAISSILSAFMGGLALGSYLIGRFVDRISPGGKVGGFIVKLLNAGSYSPYVRIYGILELFIGFYVLLTPLLIGVVNNIYISIMQNYSPGLYLISIITFFLSVMVFIIPTVFMGATLPVICKFVVRSFREIMPKTAKLYSINTFGAVLGTFLAGFILFPVMGLKASLLTGAVINISIGVIVILLDLIASRSSQKAKEEIKEQSPKEEIKDKEEKGQEKETDDRDNKQPELSPETPPETSNEETKKVKSLYKLVLVVYFISGFTGMVYEVGWSRALALSIGSSTYSFTIILTTFLFGIALGSYIFSNAKWFKPEKISIFSLGDVELAIGLLGFIILPALGFLPFIFLKMFPVVKSSYTAILAGNFLLSFIVILLPTLLFGITFPMVVRIYTANLKNLGKSIGNVYAANTLGGILGSFLAGFMFIPIFGAEITLKIAISLNIIAALLIYIFSGQKRKILASIARYGVIAVLLILIFTLKIWRHSAMSLGVAVYAKNLSYVQSWQDYKNELDRQKRHIVFYKDGISSTVTVVKVKEQITLRVNGKADASWNKNASGDISTQWLLGFLPNILHPDPQRVCVIGFGSGMTVDSVNNFREPELIDCIEIEPAVMEAAPWFNEANHDVQKSPRVKIHIADGRNFIEASKKKYDVIISEPSNPWIAGIGNLFSLDFYKVCRERLEDDGIYAQWFHSYSMSREDTQMVFKTFFSAFPYGSVWFTGSGDFLLIGKKKPSPVDYERIKTVFKDNEKAREGMKLLGLTEPYQVLAYRITGADQARAFSLGAKLNTDDHPLLEFNAPRNLYTITDHMAMLREMFQYRIPVDDNVVNLDKALMKTGKFYEQIGQVYKKYYFFEVAKDFFEKASKFPDYKYYGMFYVAVSDYAQKRYIETFNTLQEVINLFPERESGYTFIIQVLEDRELNERAYEYAQAGLKYLPDNTEILNKAANLAIKLKKYPDAREYTEKLLLKDKDNPDYNLYIGKILLAEKDPAKAEQFVIKSISKKPGYKDALLVLAKIRIQQDNYKEAEKVLKSLINIDKNMTDPRIILARCYEKMGKRESAIKQLKYIITSIDINNKDAREYLYRLEKQEGKLPD